MKQLTAFMKKETTELFRTGKFWILIIIFTLFGIMNPAIAKLTPWLYDMLSDSMAEQGITVTKVEVTALTSWEQFYKNVPIAIIVFVLLIGGILVNEYQKGTLINMLTKGLKRWKVIVAKFTVTALSWTLSYWLCFGITYAYNAYFWDNAVASHPWFAAVCIYVFGLWLITILMLASCWFSNSSGVLLTLCLSVGALYLLSMVPAIAPYLPTQLLGSGNIVKKASACTDFTKAFIVTILTSIAFLITSIEIFNRKRL